MGVRQKKKKKKNFCASHLTKFLIDSHGIDILLTLFSYIIPMLKISCPINI